jgi:hypothetical protein
MEKEKSQTEPRARAAPALYGLSRGYQEGEEAMGDPFQVFDWG